MDKKPTVKTETAKVEKQDQSLKVKSGLSAGWSITPTTKSPEVVPVHL